MNARDSARSIASAPPSAILSRHAIEELKAIYRNHYGGDLTDDEAYEMGNRLVRVFAVLMRMPATPAEETKKGSNPVSFD